MNRRRTYVLRERVRTTILSRSAKIKPISFQLSNLFVFYSWCDQNTDKGVAALNKTSKNLLAESTDRWRGLGRESGPLALHVGMFNVDCRLAVATCTQIIPPRNTVHDLWLQILFSFLRFNSICLRNSWFTVHAVPACLWTQAFQCYITTKR